MKFEQIRMAGTVHKKAMNERAKQMRLGNI